MRIGTIYFIGIFSLVLAISSSRASTLDFELLKNADERALLDSVINFLEPYKPTIRKWFWDLSGVSYNNPFSKGPQPRAEYITCEICTLALPYIREFLNAGITGDTIIAVVTIACQALNLAPRPDICLPTIKSYATSMLYIVEHKPDMPDGDFCGIINPGCVEISSKLKEWKIRVNNEKPLPTIRPAPPPSGTELTKILQFTDIHLDLDYNGNGTNAACGLPICCRTPDGKPENEIDASGQYGHFGCALPPSALQAMYMHAANEHKDAKFIFLSGDYVHSGVWLYSPEENGRHIRSVTQWLKEAFNETDVTILPLTGNHEPDVVNMYPPTAAWGDFPLTWMYDAVVEPFKDIFPPSELERFRKYGYYTIVVENDLRFVVLNTNICYIQNFWLPFDAIDTFGQLQWFADTMNLAEILGQKVFIMGHIHTGSGSCWPVWSNQFQRIINRYEAIIKGQWYGHSHEQDYKITFEEETGRPISVSYMAGSCLTDGMNPAYNVYYADGERNNTSTWEIINHETWILNLTASNERPMGEDAVFKKILNAQTDFNMTSLAPEEVHGFIHRMACDSDLFHKYQKVQVKGEDSPRFHPCHNDTECKAGVLGDLFVANSADYTHSEKIKEYIRTGGCESQNGNGTNALQSCTIFMFSLMFLILRVSSQ